jgi:hypothetical protein
MPETPVHSTTPRLSEPSEDEIDAEIREHQLASDHIYVRPSTSPLADNCELEAARRYRQELLASGEFDPYEIDAMVEGYKNRFPHMPQGWVPPWCEDRH